MRKWSNIYLNFSFLLCSWKIETLFLKLKDQSYRLCSFKWMVKLFCDCRPCHGVTDSGSWRNKQSKAKPTWKPVFVSLSQSFHRKSNMNHCPTESGFMLFWKHYRSRLTSFWRSHLIRIYTVFDSACKIHLSYDVASGSEITPCNKICKPLVVYRFTGNVMTSIATLRT